MQELDSSGNAHHQSVWRLSKDLQSAAAILIQRVFRYRQSMKATFNDSPWSDTPVVALQYLMCLTQISCRSLRLLFSVRFVARLGA